MKNLLDDKEMIIDDSFKCVNELFFLVLDRRVGRLKREHRLCYSLLGSIILDLETKLRGQNCVV